MIVTFFILYYYSSGAWKFVKTNIYDQYFGCKNSESADDSSKSLFEIPSVDSVAFVNDEDGLRFSPPVYAQRYATVQGVLKKKITEGTAYKVVDFGCSDSSFFLYYLKNMKGVHEVLCVDIDGELLNRHYSRAIPLNSDYLDKRSDPLKVWVLNGSVSESDIRLKDTNAVVAIELIEHLYPDTLEELPYAIFGVIQPEVAIFTTPNADFNVLFTNFTGVRHYDHKFEWSRDEFEAWGNNLTVRYPHYEVCYKGIGPGPEGTEKYGSCSQMAVFSRKINAPSKVDSTNEFSDVYKVVYTVDYPVHVETRNMDDVIRYDAESFIRYASMRDEFMINNRIEIPFTDIMRNVPYTCTSCDMLREILLHAGWKVEKGANGEDAVILPSYGLDTDSSSTASNGVTTNDQLNWYLDDAPEECWDNEEPRPESVPNKGSPHHFPNHSSHQLTDWDLSYRQLNGACQSSDIDETPPTQVAGPVTITDSDNKQAEALAQSSAVSNDARENLTASQEPNSLITKELTQEDALLDDVVYMGTSVLPKDPFEDQPYSSRPVCRCHSFEHISVNVNKNKNFRHSLCCDDKPSCCDSVCAKNMPSNGDKEGSTEEIASGGSHCDAVQLRLEDSQSQSKAGDSGYPNSAEQDMDMDLTPEQVDEIVTESESSFEEGDDEESVNGDREEQRRVGVGAGVVPAQWADNMENGDVANNNRDWEGNNMEGDAHVGEALMFERLIDQRDFALPLMDAAQHDFDSDDENKYVSACEYLNTSDETLLASDESLCHGSPFEMTVNDDLATPGCSGMHELQRSTSTDVLPPCLPVNSGHSFLSMADSGISIQSDEDLVYRLLSDESYGDGFLIPEIMVGDDVFPQWLLDVLIDEVDTLGGAGDASNEEEIDDIDDSDESGEQVELVPTVEGDNMGGGDPIAN